MSEINVQEHERTLEYLKQQKFYTQIILESKMRELTLSLDTYQITDNTELSTFETVILPLKNHIDTLVNQILTIKERALSASHYSALEFKEIEINDIPALFTTIRVDRDYIPRGYYAYDVRSNIENEFASIEPFVNANYSGTVLTKQIIEMGDKCCVPIINHHFLEKSVIGYHLTPSQIGIQELIDTFALRHRTFLDKIERACEYSNGLRMHTKTKSPSYFAEVLIPICLWIAESLREKGIDVTIPNPETYHPISGYFRIKAGGRIVGGISVPSSSDKALYFTRFNRATRIGEKIKITNIEQICELILGQVNRHV